MKTRFTHHSEYGKLNSVIIKEAWKAFFNQEKINAEWQALNFIHAPDFVKADTEYRIFESILKQHVEHIHYLPFSIETNLDSIYCRDAVIVTDYGLILCNMGKALRQSEPEAIHTFCLENDIPVLGKIIPPGTLEGGDTAWIDEQTLAVGLTYRTNKSGIDQLKRMLSPFEINVITVSLPHYKGPEDVFHLMSVFSPIDRDVAVVYSPLLPIEFRNELLDRAWHLIEVPAEEFENMACNVLALGPRHCVLLAGNPKTETALLKAGCIVLAYEGENISWLGGGGPTCLTRPLRRLMVDTGFE